jgi:hypothetical protein
MGWSLVKRGPTKCLNRLRNHLVGAGEVVSRTVEPQGRGGGVGVLCYSGEESVLSVDDKSMFT